jgi:hypothetical protein
MRRVPDPSVRHSMRTVVVGFPDISILAPNPNIIPIVRALIRGVCAHEANQFTSSVKGERC